MADDFDPFGPEETKPKPAPEADFPADFFEDAPEPAPEPPARPPVQYHAPAPPATPPTTASAIPKPSAPPPAFVREAAPEPAVGIPATPLVLGLLFASALGASLYMSRGEAAAATTAAAPAAAPDPAAPAPAAEPSPADALAGDVKGVKSQVDTLAGQLKEMQAKVDAMSKSAPAVDMKPVEGKIEDLARSVAVVVPLAGKVGKIEERFGTVDGTVASLKEEVASLSGELKKMVAARPAEGPTPATAPEPAAPKPAEAKADMSTGVELFNAAKYPEAAAAFKKLEGDEPKDARYYYYTALLKGLNSNEWQAADTLKVAARGAALEKAGEPKAEEVDAAFAKLPDNLKAWLKFYRQPK